MSVSRVPKPKSNKLPKVEEPIIEVPAATEEPEPPTREHNKIVATVGELALLFENIHTELVNEFSNMGHYDPHEGARELLSSSFGVAMLSVNSKRAASNTKPKLVGFNR